MGLNIPLLLASILSMAVAVEVTYASRNASFTSWRFGLSFAVTLACALFSVEALLVVIYQLLRTAQ